MTNTLPYRYSPPVDRLLTYGDCRTMCDWPNYLELGLTAEHVPELIRMIADEDLHFADSGGLEVWAPVHAWRALGQLRTEAAIQPLIELLVFFDNEIEGDEYVVEELPKVFGLIGRAAIPALAAYLQNDEYLTQSRTTAANSLRRVAEQDAAVRDEVVALLSRQLAEFDGQDEGFNGFLVSDLVDLRATEALPVIEQAFAADAVDELIRGDWEDVQIEFGLKAERETPRPNYFLESFSPEPEELLPMIADEIKHLSLLDRKDAKKAKAKRKQAKKMRKKNRKK
jgi:HEAT repeat protein